MLAAALLWCGEAPAQSAAAARLDFLGNIFTGFESQDPSGADSAAPAQPRFAGSGGHSPGAARTAPPAIP
jgi:hypothetical protein